MSIFLMYMSVEFSKLNRILKLDTTENISFIASHYNKK